MRNKLIYSGVILAALITSSHASTIWIGGVNGGDGLSFFQEANWDTDGDVSAPYTTPSAGSINPGTALAVDSYFVTEETITNIGTLTLGNGSTSLTLDNSSINTASGLGTLGAGQLNLNNGSDYTTQFLNSGLIVNIDSSSTLNLVGAGSPLPSATINLTGGGALVFTSGTPGILNPGSIFNIGSGNAYATTGDISADFTFTGTQASPTSITAIPEPATLGMVAVFGGGIFFIRRKLMI